MNRPTACIILLSFALASPYVRAAGQLPTYYPAPAFKLTDQDNRPVTLSDLRGKTWVVDFIFTRCGGPCPLMTQKLVDLAKEVKSSDFRMVSITVDPDFDGPQVLKAYAKAQGATDPRFIFLTGGRDIIYDLAQKGFKMTALPARDGEPIMHDERFLLIDSAGDVRGVYHSKDPESMRMLAEDATTLSTGGKPFVTTAPAPTNRDEMIARFPAINATLNATSGILLCLAMVLIQAKRVRGHAILMIAAVISSTAFLACYLTYHYLKYQAGGALTRFPQSPWRPLYLVILISHTILAVVVIPLVIVTLVRAGRRQWDRHRRIARPTFWIWLYVSATGVLVYWMLYQLAPRIAAQV